MRPPHPAASFLPKALVLAAAESAACVAGTGARHGYTAGKEGDLSLAPDDVVRLLWGEPKRWWKGENLSQGGASGVFPRNYVALLPKALARMDFPPPQGEGDEGAVGFDGARDLQFKKGDLIVLTDHRVRKKWWSGFVLGRWDGAGPPPDYRAADAGAPPTPRAFPSDFVQMEPLDEPFVRAPPPPLAFPGAVQRSPALPDARACFVRAGGSR